jgi:hypothetical protein
MRKPLKSTRELRNHLQHHQASLGGRVVSLFDVEAVTCCELDNGFVVGCQVAKHGKVEVVLAPLATLPAKYLTARQPAPRPMMLLLLGRKFRGLIGHKESGDVSLDFGRYRLRLDRASVEIGIEDGIDQPDLHDLPEDEHLSIEDQIRNAQELGSAKAKFVF